MDKELFLNIPHIGELYFDEIYAYYDCPQVFACRDRYYRAYLFTYATFDDKSDTWIGCPVSDAKIALLKCRKLSVFDALAKNEDGSGKVWRIVLDNSTSMINCESVLFTSISDDLLPDSDYYIDFEIDDLPQLSTEDLLAATNERRDICVISFEDKNHSKEINANALSILLTCIQNVTSSFSKKIEKTTRRISSAILESTKLCVAGCRAGSFAIILKSNEIADLMNETSISSLIQQFIYFVQLEDSEEEIRDFLQDKSPVIAYHLLRLYNNLLRHDMTCEIHASFASGTMCSTEISNDSLPKRITNLSHVIESEKVLREFEGKFIVINIATNKFTFLINSEDKEWIQGKIGDSVNREITTEKDCKITVEETEFLDDITGEIKKRYLLLAHEVLV